MITSYTWFRNISHFKSHLPCTSHNAYSDNTPLSTYQHLSLILLLTFVPNLAAQFLHGVILCSILKPSSLFSLNKLQGALVKTPTSFSLFLLIKEVVGNYVKMSLSRGKAAQDSAGVSTATDLWHSAVASDSRCPHAARNSAV